MILVRVSVLDKHVSSHLELKISAAMRFFVIMTFCHTFDLSHQKCSFCDLDTAVVQTQIEEKNKLTYTHIHSFQELSEPLFRQTCTLFGLMVLPISLKWGYQTLTAKKFNWSRIFKLNNAFYRLKWQQCTEAVNLSGNLMVINYSKHLFLH